MNKLPFNKISLASLSGLALAGCNPVNSGNGLPAFETPPNIVLIAIDDMNNWVGAWGGQAKTPNIDKLAAEGRMFSNAYCVAPASNPSRVAMLTGLRPETTGQFVNEGNFRDLPGGADMITLPQFLSSKGYYSVAAGKIFHHPRGNDETPRPFSDDLSWDYQWRGDVGTPGHNLFLNDDGYAKWLEGAEKDYVTGSYVNSGMVYMTRFGVWGAIPHHKEQCGDWKLASFGAGFVQQDHDKPFFLALGIFRPHSPQIVPQEFIDMYPLDEIELPELPDDDLDDVPDSARRNWSTPFVRLVKEKGQLAKAVQGYLASCSFADACVGQFMEALDKSKYRDNTIVILVTDHGFQLGHKDRWEKFSLWRQGTHTPMIIRLPGSIVKPGATNAATSLLDIYPTITELLGLEPPRKLDGTSLVPLLLNPSSKRETPAIITWERGSHSLVRDSWNYIHYHDGSEELYNHIIDPNEFKNLADDPQYREMMNELKGYKPEDYKPVLPPEAPADNPEQRQIDQ